ncbi:MAG: S8 family peptidase [Pseudomonadota bacterium]|nr:S8 family peptidase [Pseudomonadota bacterium]
MDEALRQLPPDAVRLVIRPIRAIAVNWEVGVLDQELIRYINPDPPDAVRITEDLLHYGVDNIDAEEVWGGAEDAVNVIPGQGGLGAKIAIIDTGIHCVHEDLAGGCNFGANFVNPPFEGDDYGHGTHVAGLAAARDNGLGTIGVAPEASLYSVKVLSSTGSGSWSQVAAGIVWAADNGMNVINMSLGGTGFDQTVSDSIEYAQSNGVLIVSAAGNSDGCATCDSVLYPAKYLHSMAIAAVNSNDVRPSFSSSGPEIDVAAPGVDNFAPVPPGPCSLCDPSGYRLLSGTSMASPHVAGLGALLMSRGLTNVEARQRIQDTALDLDPVGKDWLTGTGRIDALAAVGGAPPPPPTPTPAPPAPTPVPPTPTPIPPPPPPSECSASFVGAAHHKEAFDLYVFRAGDCVGSFTFALNWATSKKNLLLQITTPGGVEHVSDCCWPERLVLPVEPGDWQVVVDTHSPGNTEYAVSVTN